MAATRGCLTCGEVLHAPNLPALERVELAHLMEHESKFEALARDHGGKP